jgi:hypothetical protein
MQLTLFPEEVPLRHPCPYPAEVLQVFATLIHPGEQVHDPYAGTSVRLGRLCDHLGAVFTGTELELPFIGDQRVVRADARDPCGYPRRPFTVVTSPTFLDRRLADYRNGPTDRTNPKGRHDYAISLGRALHPDNTARHTGRSAQHEIDAYWAAHAAAVQHWHQRAIVNMSQVSAQAWCALLRDGGYRIEAVVDVPTRGYGRKGHEPEVVTVAIRPPAPAVAFGSCPPKTESNWPAAR